MGCWVDKVGCDVSQLQMVEVSEDIFYQVKKEILDKLDLILQKVNLQIINYIRPEEEEFSFIELSSFEGELTHLFQYLDRLYASLNSSVSFSSIQSYKSTAENIQAQNQKLLAQNSLLRKTVAVMQQQMREMGSEMRTMGRELRKQMKNYKFEMLEVRVEIISRMKEFQIGCRPDEREREVERERERERDREREMEVERERQWREEHLDQDGRDVLDAIHRILAIC